MTRIGGLLSTSTHILISSPQDGTHRWCSLISPLAIGCPSAFIAIDLGETGYDDEPLLVARSHGTCTRPGGLSEMDDDQEEDPFCCWGGNASPSPASFVKTDE